MTLIGGAGGLAVEQLPIEQIQLGDYVVAKDDNGKTYVYQVHAKRFEFDKSAGASMVMFQGEPKPGVALVPQSGGPIGTLAHRVILDPSQSAHPEPTQSEHHRPSKQSQKPATTTDVDLDYRHPKCYANTGGGCSTKISGEHFISHSLIKLYGFDDPTLTIKHDTGYGIPKFVKPSKFVANVLCEKHNNDLHVADDAALEFAKFMRTIAMRYKNGAGEWGSDEEITISGDHFQAWVLKLILNHVVGKAFVHQKGELVSPFPPEAVDVLLGRAMWPRTWGLCVAGDANNKDLRINAFDRFEDITTEWCSFQPFIHNDGWIGGGIVNLNGVGFGLTVFNPSRDNPEAFNHPGNPLRGSIQRPGYMAWEIDGVQKRVNFTWSDIWEHKTVTYTMIHGE